MANHSLVSAGGSEKVQAASATNLPIATTADFTIQFWHKSAAASYVALSQVFGFGPQLPSGASSTDGRYNLQFGGSGDYYFWGLGNDYDTTVAYLQDDAWHHIVWTYDHTTQHLDFWLDGTLIATATNYVLQATAGTYVTAFSKHSSGTISPNLLLCDPAIWSVVLSSTDIADLAATTKRPSDLSTNLQMYWPLTEGSGTSAADFTSNHNDGTLSGSAGWSTDTPFAGGGSFTLDCSPGTFTLTGSSAGLLTARKLSGSSGALTLTGQAAGLAHNYPMSGGAGAYTVTGGSASLLAARKLSGTAGALTLTGSAATLARTRAIDAGAGVYTLTGAQASLLTGRKLSAGAGALTVNGQSATLDHGFTLIAAAGSYTLTGANAGLSWDHILAGAAGVYTLTGQPASLLAARKLSAAPGVLTVTGAAAGLLALRVLFGAAGIYTVSGQSASLLHDRVLSASPGALTLTGQSASMFQGFTLDALPGVYTLTGSTASPTHARVLLAAPGVYTLHGQAATLTFTTTTAEIAGTWYELFRGVVWIEESRPAIWTEDARSTTWIGNEDGMAGTLIARGSEVAVYKDDLSALPELTAGDTIASIVSVTQTPLSASAPALTIGSPSIISGIGGSARAVAFQITMPSIPGYRYRIKTVVLTAGGLTKAGIGFLNTSDD